MQLENFKGMYYRLADNWLPELPISDKPIKYLEIGAYYGGNLISVEKIFAKHPESELHCIDPWIDYEEYDEYKGEMESIYSAFQQNIKNAGIESKLRVHRGFSHNKIVELPDNYFDMIYVDGNHSPEYVLEDCVLSFRKLKQGGYLIIDDYGWGGADYTSRGIDAFLNSYRERIVYNPKDKNSQIFVYKRN